MSNNFNLERGQERVHTFSLHSSFSLLFFNVIIEVQLNCQLLKRLKKKNNSPLMWHHIFYKSKYMKWYFYENSIAELWDDNFGCIENDIMMRKRQSHFSLFLGWHIQCIYLILGPHVRSNTCSLSIVAFTFLVFDTILKNKKIKKKEDLMCGDRFFFSFFF